MGDRGEAARVEGLLEGLLSKKGKMIGVRELAKVASVIGSFTLAMANVARFYTREMLTQVAEMAGRDGWESHGLMERRVLDEIVFWKENLRSLNG